LRKTFEETALAMTRPGEIATDSTGSRDFFVTHDLADQDWAEWIAAELEAAGYTTILPGRDFRPGEDLQAKTNEALAGSRHTLGVVSAASLGSEAWTWTAAYHQGQLGKQRSLIPIRVQDGDPPPLLAPIIAIELVGVVEEEEARQRLLEGVAARVDRQPRRGFPGAPPATTQHTARFPGKPAVVWELRGQQPVEHFVGREDKLNELYRKLRSGRTTARLQAIVGMGGIGKTKIAVEYAHRHQLAYDIVWWMRGEEPTVLLGDYLELLPYLALPDIKEPDLAVAAIRQELGRRDHWLLIFDNVDVERAETVERFLPQPQRGHTIVTSRHPDWPHAETLAVEVLDRDAAIGYLQRRTGAADGDAAGRLAEALGYLPLALAQAAAVISQGISLSEYLELLKQRAPELFATGKAPDYNFTVASTWKLSLERLAHDSPAAVALLRLCAFLGPEAVPLQFLTVIKDLPAELTQALGDPLHRLQSTQALRAYSLADPSLGMLSVHRLVQAVVRAELAAAQPDWATHALRILNVAFPPQSDDPVEWQQCEALLSHALAATGHARHFRIAITETVELLNRVASYLLARGRLGQARIIADHAVTSAAALGTDHPLVLTSKHTLGRILFSQREITPARDLQEHVYERRKLVLGEEHPDTLRAGRDLVEARYRAWDRLGAQSLLEQLLAVDRRVLGDDNPETVTAVAYQATILKDEGRQAAARHLEEQVLETRRRLFGPHHPDTLTAMGNLAATRGEQGELAAARQLEEQVLDGLRRLLGPDHPDTLNAMGNLAAMLYDQGNLKEARRLFSEGLSKSKNLLGQRHPLTTRCAWGLALVYRSAGNWPGLRTVIALDLAWLRKARVIDLSGEQQRIKAAVARVQKGGGPRRRR
jgi:tetratricopeptide (TPR) repeat protein